MKFIIISLFVAISVSVITFFSLNDYGITWDEPIYMFSGTSYFQWLLHPQIDTINDVFLVSEKTDIHPPLIKIIAGFSHEVFVNKLHIASDIVGYRISAIFYVFVLVFSLTYIACKKLGCLIGIGVGIGFSFFPSVFFLSHLVTTDYPMTALWFLTLSLFMYEINLKRPPYYSGLFLGLALLIKINGYILIIFFGLFTVWRSFRVFYLDHKKEDELFYCKKFILLVIFSAIIYYIFWPWLWINPFQKWIEYLFLQFTHGYIPVYFFHILYDNPPWYYTPFMFFATMPVLFIIFIVIGSIYSVFRGNEWQKWMFVYMIFPILFFSLPFNYRYDGTRLFLSAYPFAALVGGIGVYAIFKIIRKCWLSHLIKYAILIGIVVTIFQSIYITHPYEQSYYNELIGGIDGAEKMGLEIEYWGSSLKNTLSWIDLQKGKTICLVPAGNFEDFYKFSGQVSNEIFFDNNLNKCDFAVVLMRRGIFQWFPNITEIVATKNPVYSVKLSKTSLINIYSLR